MSWPWDDWELVPECDGEVIDYQPWDEVVWQWILDEGSRLWRRAGYCKTCLKQGVALTDGWCAQCYEAFSPDEGQPPVSRDLDCGRWARRPTPTPDVPPTPCTDSWCSDGCVIEP